MALTRLFRRGHEAIATAVQRLDEPLRLPCVTDRLTGLFDAGIQRGLTDELLGPQVIEKLLPGDDSSAMGDEIEQDIKHFRAELDHHACAAQFIAARVQHIVTKEVPHGA